MAVISKIERPEKIKIPEARSPGYRKWVENGACILRNELPFEGPADISITVGSGLAAIVDQLNLGDVRHISYDQIGLPVGENMQHKKEIIAGLSPEGKKVAIVNGRTHAYEIPEEGVLTDSWGRLGRMELATGYLAMLNEIGVENVVLTCAAGGINHPMFDDQEKPFEEKNLPVISLIASDLNEAYPSPHMGHYKAGRGDFFGLKDADEPLMAMLEMSMWQSRLEESGLQKTGEESPKQMPYVYYFSSRATPNFEDRAAIYNAAINGGQALGMSYSYEKEFLSGLINMGRFIGIAVITNSVELVYKRPETYRTRTSVSVNELRQHYPWEFDIAHPASDKEVQKIGSLARVRLGNGLRQLIKNV